MPREGGRVLAGGADLRLFLQGHAVRHAHIHELRRGAAAAPHRRDRLIELQ